MFGLGGIFSLITSGLGFLTGIAPAISSYLVQAKNVEAQEFSTMSETDRAEYIAYTQATSALNSAKVINNTSRAAQVMIYLFGLPAALHWGAVYITATLNGWPYAVDPLHGLYASAEHDIAISFFVMAPTLPVVSALASRLRGQ